ncbi:MAG: NAD(P)-dependent oxidoreductase [Lachnospiraceae bacterium]|nr:NAD(P)-dependent oxidoreductase [Lachnospiraceae bacterium]
MSIHVVKEAKRCLQCKFPQCVKGCPVSTPIPEMIRLFLEGKSDEAGDILFENNPLSSVCALVCDHDAQCEGHCIQAKKGIAVQWSSIENYISEGYLERACRTQAPRNHIKAAIIGSGPAGITIAVRLALKGYDVTLFDSREKIGGVLRYGIPEFRLPKALLDRYVNKLQEMGVHIRPNTTIGGALTIDDLFRDGYRSVFIGTGVWRPQALGVKGETLGNVHFAINYLSNPDVYRLGDSVAIIGSGNAAMDVARTVVRHGSRHVTVYCFRDRPTASDREVMYAKADGVTFMTHLEIEEIVDEGPLFRRVELDDNGQVVNYSEPALYPADSTIIAIGQRPKDKIVGSTAGIAVTANGLIWTDESGKTTHPGIFASGDVTRGARTVVEAVKYSKDVADAMDAYMQSLKN